eukprot:Rmarinus@m.12522
MQYILLPPLINGIESTKGFRIMIRYIRSPYFVPFAISSQSHIIISLALIMISVRLYIHDTNFCWNTNAMYNHDCNDGIMMIMTSVGLLLPCTIIMIMILPCTVIMIMISCRLLMLTIKASVL